MCEYRERERHNISKKTPLLCVILDEAAKDNLKGKMEGE